tara:strand:- start:369 stop:1319 length:951 start_codon:yes stop_codon:yes gene_type:complete
MHFTYSENSKTKKNVNTQPQPNNQLNVNLTQNEINIINKYKLNNEEEFNLFKYNLLPEINIININDVKINNNEDEFIIYINNEKILFNKNTFKFIIDYNDSITTENIIDIPSNRDYYYIVDYHKDKENIIKIIKDNPEIILNVKYSAFTSNIYTKYMVIKTSYIYSINFYFILSKLNMFPTIYKIIESKSYFYLIIKNETYIIENNVYNLYNINNKINLITDNRNFIYNNIFFKRIYKFLYILNLLNMSFIDDIQSCDYMITNNNLYFTLMQNYIIYNTRKKCYHLKNNGSITILSSNNYNINNYKYNDHSFQEIC